MNAQSTLVRVSFHIVTHLVSPSPYVCTEDQDSSFHMSSRCIELCPLFIFRRWNAQAITQRPPEAYLRTCHLEIVLSAPSPSFSRSPCCTHTIESFPAGMELYGILEYGWIRNAPSAVLRVISRAISWYGLTPPPSPPPVTLLLPPVPDRFRF